MTPNEMPCDIVWPDLCGDLWRSWIAGIVADPEMSEARLIEHLRLHCTSHMPEPHDHKDRWEQWLIGTYNLLAILAQQKGIEPTYELAIGRLFQKWRQHPTDHTPPPAGQISICRDVGRIS